MVIDTSALLAILFLEPGCDRIALAISRDSRRLASAFAVLEAGIVVESRKGARGARPASPSH